jgi:archaellum component FlaC
MDVKEFPRKKHENHFNYTDDQLAEKKLALEKLKIIYKEVPEYYAELVYDLCANTDPEKIEAIKKKIDTTPFKYDYSGLQEELNRVKDAYTLTTNEELDELDKQLNKASPP